MPATSWHDLDRRAHRTHGLVRRADVPLSRDQIRRARERGQLRLEHPGVLRLVGSPRTKEQRLLAAIWAAGRVAAGSHRCAAALLHVGIDWPANPEICVPGDRRPRLKGVTVHRSKALVPEFITVVDGIPVTSPLLTMVQLGSVLGTTLVARAVEQGLIRKLFTIAELEKFLAHVGRSGRDGSGVLRSVLEERALGE